MTSAETTKPPLRQRIWAELFRDVDVVSLAFFRIVYGLSMMWLAWMYFGEEELAFLSRQGIHLTYLGFDWVRPWPGDGMYYHMYVLRIVSIFITIGFLYRFSMAIFFLGYTHVFLIDTGFYQNHFYLVSLMCFLLIFMPAHKAYSIDSWLWPKWRSYTVPKWPVWTIRLQFSLVYFWAAITKMNGDWIQGEPLTTTAAPFAADIGLSASFVGIAMSYTGLLFDLLAGFLLLIPATRLAAYLVTLIFHGMNAWIWDIDIFPYMLAFGSLIYFAPDWPWRLWARLRERTYESPIPAQQAPAVTRGRQICAALLAIYFTVHMLLPPRHFLYPGNVLWTDEARFFAWRMMAVRKRTIATFHARDPATGEEWIVDPQDFGFPHYGSFSPWSITSNVHIFAVKVAEELAKQGRPGVEIRAEVYCSMNKRKPQLLIDPNVNLAAEPRTIWPKPWITELKEPLPTTTAEKRQALDAWEKVAGTRNGW